jgi:hypothetical protein
VGSLSWGGRELEHYEDADPVPPWSRISGQAFWTFLLNAKFSRFPTYVQVNIHTLSIFSDREPSLVGAMRINYGDRAAPTFEKLPDIDLVYPEVFDDSRNYEFRTIFLENSLVVVGHLKSYRGASGYIFLFAAISIGSIGISGTTPIVMRLTQYTLELPDALHQRWLGMTAFYSPIVRLDQVYMVFQMGESFQYFHFPWTRQLLPHCCAFQSRA